MNLINGFKNCHHHINFGAKNPKLIFLQLCIISRLIGNRKKSNPIKMWSSFCRCHQYTIFHVPVWRTNKMQLGFHYTCQCQSLRHHALYELFQWYLIARAAVLRPKFRTHKSLELQFCALQAWQDLKYENCWKSKVYSTVCHIFSRFSNTRHKNNLVLMCSHLYPSRHLVIFSGIELFVTCGKRITDTRIKVEGKS